MFEMVVSLNFVADAITFVFPCRIGFISYSPFSLVVAFATAPSALIVAPAIGELSAAFFTTPFKVVVVCDGSIIILLIL